MADIWRGVERDHAVACVNHALETRHQFHRYRRCLWTRSRGKLPERGFDGEATQRQIRTVRMQCATILFPRFFALGPLRRSFSLHALEGEKGLADNSLTTRQFLATGRTRHTPPVALFIDLSWSQYSSLRQLDQYDNRFQHVRSLRES